MKVIDKRIIDISQLQSPCKLEKLIFIRIDPEDKREAIEKIYCEISNISWINKFDRSYLKNSYRKKAEKTIDSIKLKLDSFEDDELTSDIGEYFVSEISRQNLISELGYRDIPLTELWKEQKSGNPGFDFHSESDNNIIIYGEAKYNSRQNAFNSALNQIAKFILEEKHIEELSELRDFVSVESLENIEKYDRKGFAAAFSSHNIDTETLIKHILDNENFKKIKIHEELILLAVNMI